MRYLCGWGVVLWIWLGVCGLCEAGDYRVVISSARLLPTKQDRSCWDLCPFWVQKQLAASARPLKGSSATWASVAASKQAIRLWKGMKLPDPYVTLSFSNGQKVRSKRLSDTLQPKWGDTFQVALKGNETVSIKVWDHDRFRKHELIGHAPSQRIPAHILKKGGQWTLRFQQVYELTLFFVKVRSATRLLFSPGLYEVTVEAASIQGHKANHKAWDIWKGLPDPFVRLQIGRFRLQTTTERNTLSPRWLCTKRMYLNGHERLRLEVWDRDIRAHDLIGVCQFRTVAQVRRNKQGVFRVRCQGARWVMVQLKKIR